MRSTRPAPLAPRVVLPALLAAVLLASCSPAPAVTPPGATLGPVDARSVPPDPEVPNETLPAPEPGHELYGYVPYWEMDGTIAAHLRRTPLTTIGLFSVTHTSGGALNRSSTGYRRITGAIGERLIREAHERGTRVEIVWTSFGKSKNRRLFEDVERQDKVIAALTALNDRVGADGINVDVELIDPEFVPAYGAFVGRLVEAVRASNPDDRVSVATTSGPLGASLAAISISAGADRAFLMGYDYHWAGSSPGASAPLDSDDDVRTLRWSLDLYAQAGVPPDRLLLGLPLYGMTWPVSAPVIGAPETGRGDAWIPRRNRDLLRDEASIAVRDEVQQVDVYFLASDGSTPPPAPGAESPHLESPHLASPDPDDDRTWTAIYVDSPETLAPKLALANERGLAGAGFWAIGYERGLPGYRSLMTRFVEGESP